MRSNGLFLAALVFGMALTATAAEHNRYKWKDAQGNLHFDDALPTEALQFGYDEVNSLGIVVKHVNRVKTAEEMKADQEAATSQAAKNRLAEEQAQRDQQLLAAYPDERDLVSAQQAQMDVIEQNIHTTQLSLDNQEKSLAELLTHAATLERGGKPVPAYQQQQIDALRRNIEKQKAYIVARQQEKPKLTQKFAEDLARYRELRAKAPH